MLSHYPTHSLLNNLWLNVMNQPKQDSLPFAASRSPLLHPLPCDVDTVLPGDAQMYHVTCDISNVCSRLLKSASMPQYQSNIARKCHFYTFFAFSLQRLLEYNEQMLKLCHMSYFITAFNLRTTALKQGHLLCHLPVFFFFPSHSSFPFIASLIWKEGSYPRLLSPVLIFVYKLYLGLQEASGPPSLPRILLVITFGTRTDWTADLHSVPLKKN